jgi:transcriptional regulator with XRE-family HTH domain
VTSAQLLGEVLLRARATVARSPEQVGTQTGVHGRTIRRLEAGESVSPRRTTLQALAAFYALNSELLAALGLWSKQDVSGEQLQERIIARAQEVLGADITHSIDAEADGADDLVIHLTMRLCRAGQRRDARDEVVTGREAEALAFVDGLLRGPAGPERDALTSLLSHLKTLDRQRTMMLCAMAREMHKAQTADRLLAERRRRSGFPPPARRSEGGW